MKELRRARNENQLIDCLNSLPRDLDATYERMLCSIDERYIDDVRRILTVLCISRRPLSIHRVIEAHTVDLSEPQHVNRKRAFHEDDILEICLGLVEISDHDNKNIWTTRIAHFSVQEYLQSDRILQQKAKAFAIQPESANTEMTQICLVYLLNPMFSNSTLDETKRSQTFPLAHYAARYWHAHYLRSGEGQQTIEPLIMRLFSNEANSFSQWASIFLLHRDLGFVLNCPLYVKAGPFVHAAYLGLDFVLDSLMSSSDADIVNAAGERSYSPMSSSDEDIVDVAAERSYSALAAASYGGHVKAVQMLLERGANAEQFGSALYAASFNGQEQVAQILLDRGANPDSFISGPTGAHSILQYKETRKG